MKKSKSLHIEVIRILAILCIMYIHTGYRGHDTYACTDSHLTFVLALIAACVSAVGVDLFWMVSGSLLLSKKEDSGVVYKKRVPRMVIVLFVFSVIRYLYEWLVVEGILPWYENNMGYVTGSFSLWDFVRRLLSGKIFEPYWFLYFYIGILLGLPFMRRAVQGMNDTEWKYFANLEIFFLIVVRIIELVPNTIIAVPFYLMEEVNAFILGYVAGNVVPKTWLRKRGVVTGLGIGCVAMVAIEYALSMVIGYPYGDHRVVFTNWLCQPLAFGLILFVRGLALRTKDGQEETGNVEESSGDGCPEWLARFIRYDGGCTFGIYLTEDYLRNGLIFIDDRLQGPVTMLPACAIWLLCCYFVGLVIVGLLKKIPGFGKLI